MMQKIPRHSGRTMEVSTLSSRIQPPTSKRRIEILVMTVVKVDTGGRIVLNSRVKRRPSHQEIVQVPSSSLTGTTNHPTNPEVHPVKEKAKSSLLEERRDTGVPSADAGQ